MKHKMDLYERTKTETNRCYRPVTATARQMVYGTQIWKTYTIPKILHGIAAIPFSNNTFIKVETQQREFIRRFSRLPRHTHRAVLYGETNILPIQMEAEKRTINYLIHLLKLDDKNIVKLALNEQIDIYRNKPDKKTWYKHAIDCCQKYNINYEQLPSTLLVKQVIYNAWIQQYQQLLNATTLKYYKGKIYPKLNRELNFYTGGEFWLKAKAGALLLNSRTNSNCTRCNDGKIETLEHFLWTCKGNFINDQNRSILQQLWGLIPKTIEGLSKDDVIPLTETVFLELATEWLLSDNCHGQAINITGKIIKKFYNERPEILLYNSIIGNTRNNNEIHQVITYMDFTGNTNTEETRQSIDEDEDSGIIKTDTIGKTNTVDTMVVNHISIQGNANTGEPGMIGHETQIHGDANTDDPRIRIPSYRHR